MLIASVNNGESDKEPLSNLIKDNTSFTEELTESLKRPSNKIVAEGNFKATEKESKDPELLMGNFNACNPCISGARRVTLFLAPEKTFANCVNVTGLRLLTMLNREDFHAKISTGDAAGGETWASARGRNITQSNNIGILTRILYSTPVQF